MSRPRRGLIRWRTLRCGRCRHSERWPLPESIEVRGWTCPHCGGGLRPPDAAGSDAAARAALGR